MQRQFTNNSTGRQPSQQHSQVQQRVESRIQHLLREAECVRGILRPNGRMPKELRALLFPSASGTFPATSSTPTKQGTCPYFTNSPNACQPGLK